MFKCSFCSKEFDTKGGLKIHITKKHLAKDEQLARINYGDEIDLTNEQLNSYMKEHLTCEICGRTVEEAVKYRGKESSKSLCADHNHATKKFRGALCQSCNRQLGWYEKHKSAVDEYLKRGI